MVNKVILVGHLGMDLELRHAGDTPVTNMNLATNYKYKDKEETTWHRVTVWGKLAETCVNYLRKGSQVYVEGRLRTTDYTDKDGVARKAWEVVASTVRFMSSADAKLGAKRREPIQGHIDDNDEIPF